VGELESIEAGCGCDRASSGAHRRGNGAEAIKKIQQGRQPCSQDADLLTLRYAYASNSLSIDRDGCGFTPAYPPKTWTVRPMAPELTRASTSLLQRYPISLDLSPKSNAAIRCKIAPFLVLRRTITAQRRAPERKVQQLAGRL
jgi:hypothetical protein